MHVSRTVRPSGCGPYFFSSALDGPRRLTFQCKGDMSNDSGSIDVEDGALRLQVNEDYSSGDYGLFGAKDAAVARQSTMEYVALPCGAGVTLQASGTTEWYPR